MDINTCFETTNYYHTIAYYSHVVPTILALFISIYALIKTKYSKLSISFFAFTFGFSLWLIGNLIDWVSPNYNIVYFTWSWLDFINIVFFVFGAYFFGILARGKISNLEKAILFSICIPAFIITLTGNSLLELNQTVCEAVENDGLTLYKLVAEAIIIALILFSFFSSWVNSDKKKRIRILIVLLAMFAFFAVFSSTEYIATVTNIYEINLYGLFVLPLFLIVMVFAITNLGLFQFRLLGTQILAYALIIMAGSQFLFIEGSADKALSIVTLLISIFFAILLLQNAKKEAEVRLKVEKLAVELQIANVRLKELDKQKSEFVSFATHQLRSPLTSILGNSSLILEGDLGPVSDPVRDVVKTILESTKTQINVVEDYLNISRIELGTMKYNFVEMDFKDFLKQIIDEQKPNIEAKGLTYTLTLDENETYKIKADPDKFKQVVMNTVDNSIKYTKQGSIAISLEKDTKKSTGSGGSGVVRLKIIDTGVGIAPGVLPKLFQKFSRAGNANESNIHGTGLGLYIAKQIMDAHGGKIWAESAGEGRGSQFYVEIPMVK